MKFKLQELTGEFGDNTREEWGKQTSKFTEDEDLLLVSKYESSLKYALDHDGNAVFYGLSREGENYACAILQLTVKLPETKSAGLRLLDIDMEPRLDVENRKIESSLDEAVKVISNCIAHAFNLTFDEIPAKTYKIYGRTDHMEIILEEVKKMILASDELKGVLDAKFQGRWLLIEKIK